MSALKRVVFLGTKPIGAHCLEYLIQHKEILQIEVIAVGTQERKEFTSALSTAEIATHNQIPIIASPDEIPECDIIYSVQYHKILKQHHIDKAKQIAVNLHLAPLPDYRGCNQFSFAIFDGATTFGVTIHQLDSGIDSGDILFEDRFELPKDIWVQDLLELSVTKGKLLFEHTIANILKGEFTKKSQTELIAVRGLKIYKRDDINWLKCIDLNESQEKTHKRIRATYMPGFELPYFMMGNQKIHISRSES